MTYDPSSFLNLAVTLCEDSNYHDESRFRTAISRAYYAAHLISRNSLESKGIILDKDSNIHWEVIRLMKEKDRHTGDMLSKLRKHRNDSDYDMNIEIKKGVVLRSLKLCDEIIKKVDNPSGK